jgi:hypothetical protein
MAVFHCFQEATCSVFQQLVKKVEKIYNYGLQTHVAMLFMQLKGKPLWRKTQVAIGDF